MNLELLAVILFSCSYITVVEKSNAQLCTDTAEGIVELLKALIQCLSSTNTDKGSEVLCPLPFS